MPSAKYAMPSDWTLADLLAQIGGVPPKRIRMRPLPGSATEKDLLRVLNHENSICELVDGVLVEKPMGFSESALAFDLGLLLGEFVRTHDLGIMAAGDGALRLLPGLVRIPDLTFISWGQLPTRTYPDRPIPDLYPDLAVEVLSRTNTRREMARKRKDYFTAGSRLVWQVDPASRTITVYTAPDQATVLRETDTLDGGAVLPGFSLPVRNVFARLGQPQPTKKSRKRK